MGEVIGLEGVGVTRDGAGVLDGIDWQVAGDERWVVLGPNGSGKTTLLAVVAARLHPSCGSVRVLGEVLGRSDWRAVRERVGFTSGALLHALRPTLAAIDVVVTGLHGALEPWWHRYSDEDRARARALLDASGVGAVADRPFGVISEGERQHVLLARLLVAEPELVLLDEPFAGLDLGARERLLARLSSFTRDPGAAPLVLVTHHVEEIPPGITHALLLRDGRIVAAGPVGEVLSAGPLGATFGLRLRVERRAGRFRVALRGS